MQIVSPFFVYVRVGRKDMNTGSIAMSDDMRACVPESRLLFDRSSDFCVLQNGTERRAWRSSSLEKESRA